MKLLLIPNSYVTALRRLISSVLQGGMEVVATVELAFEELLS